MSVAAFVDKSKYVCFDFDLCMRALPAVWARLPQTLVLRGDDKGWRKITKQCKDFLIGRKLEICKNTKVKNRI